MRRNGFEGWLLRRCGWFMPVVFRLAFYLVWHVLFGGFGGRTSAIKAALQLG
jgi:hypothetical protein